MIYIRKNKHFNSYNACKLGRTFNIKDRESNYITCEIEKGYFSDVYKFISNDIKLIEEDLQENFKELNIYYKGSGKEFYDLSIVDKLELYLIYKKYNFIKLTKEEILEHTRTDRPKNNIIIKSNEYQNDILNNIVDFYNINNIGKLLWCCGLGKTIMSIFIVKKLNCNKILIVVPFNHLMKQFKEEILKIFPNESNILFLKNNYNKIIRFLNNNNNKPKFIISTYASCNLLNNDNINFDLKIADECHHLVGIQKTDKSYTIFHKIKSNKTLFMTATEKNVINKNNNIYSMDDEKIFGKLIDFKSVKWSIENKKITDYYVLIVRNTINEITIIIKSLNIEEEVNINLLLCAYICLKSIYDNKELTHVIIYTNTTKNADLVKKYIDIIIDKKIIILNKCDLYNNSLHSNQFDNKNILQNEIDLFKNSKYGIISSVYIFGEGTNLPFLNGVCFAENMESDIRIIQCALRPNRLDYNNPNKISYVIIPYIDNDDNNQKCKKIIGKLRNVDENIECKIKLLDNTYNKNKNKKEKIENNDIIYTENLEELEKIKLRLKHSKTLLSDCSDELNEYNLVKLYNKSLNIKSKEEYIKNKNIHEFYIENAEEYFTKNCVWTNWYDFIGYETKEFIKTKEEWIKFCKEKSIKSLKDYDKLCDEYKEIPKNPSEYYKNFTNISNELKIYNEIKRR